MGKRSAFERRAGDAYPTPIEAVLPLIPHLRGVRNFAEPCAGDGALVRHLESFGLCCTHAGDIAIGQDALACDSLGGVPIITNPPWRRDQLHALIGHFMRCAPFCWLLFDANWAHTRQSPASSAADHWPVGRNRSMSRLSCEMLVTPISFMSRSISARMLQSAFSTPGCPAAASA